ncbi:MAG: MerR family transcriptional regulator, partial [Planctomycetaceae bacterium]
MEQSLQELMTIGVLAKEAGVGVETIRFYQRKGLLKTPQRTSGFRKYTQADLRRIKFIKRVQGLGFTLNDAQSLLDINACSPETQP